MPKLQLVGIRTHVYYSGKSQGGVGKTTTALHLAAYFQKLAPTLLIDGDPNRSARAWARNDEMPFHIVDAAQGAFEARKYEHVII